MLQGREKYKKRHKGRQMKPVFWFVGLAGILHKETMDNRT